MAGLIGDKLGVPADRFEVLPLGYRRRWDGQPPLDPDPPDGAACRFAFWGGVGRHKGVLVLLEAFRRLRDEGVAAELHVLGGFESPDFEREVRAAAEGTGAVFHGPFDAASLRAAHPHCGVFPSTCIETHGIVLDECYELGLPAVVSDLGALGVRVGGGGIAVPPGDAAALARAMAEVATDPERRRALIAGRPALPPDGAEYARRVASVYGHVTGVRPADTTGAGVPLARRLAFLQRQRESAYRQPVPPGGPK